jgi:hypothetical protein
MLPEVRKKLSECIEDKMQYECVNWLTIQKVDIKKNWDSPYSWGIWRRIVKDDTYIMSASHLAKMLEYFDIPYNNNFGIITLFKEPIIINEDE